MEQTGAKYWEEKLETPGRNGDFVGKKRRLATESQSPTYIFKVPMIPITNSFLLH